MTESGNFKGLSELKISLNGRKESLLFKLFPPKPKIIGSGFFPEQTVIQALKQWEAKKKKPEISEQFQQTAKRKFLKNLKLAIGDQEFRVKYYNYQSRFWHRMENLFYQSEASRNFRLMNYVLSKGMLAPRPLALVEHRFWGIALESILMMEELESAKSYKEMIREVESDPQELIRFLKEIFLSLAQFNRTGLYSLDSDKNLLIKKRNGKNRIHLLDFDNVFAFRKNNPRRAGRTIYFLIRVRKIFQKLRPGELEGLIDLYLEQLGKKSWREDLIEEIKKIALRKDPEDLPGLKNQIG